MAATDRIARVAGAVCVAWALSACADARTPELGSGLIVTPSGAPFEGSSNPSPTPSFVPTPSGDGGAPAMRAMCANTAMFTSVVQPLLVTECARCHNGTKGRATVTYDLTTLVDLSPEAQQYACDWTLTTADPARGEGAPFFAEVNPSDASTVHDFKFATPAEYAAFRDGVTPWLSSE